MRGLIVLISLTAVVEVLSTVTQLRVLTTSPCTDIFQIGVENNRPVGVITTLVPKPEVYEFQVNASFALIVNQVSRKLLGQSTHKIKTSSIFNTVLISVY